MVSIEAVKEILAQFGTIWVLWLLVGLSVVSVLIIIERIWLYRSAEGDLESLARGLDQKLSTNNYEGALSLLRTSSSVAASITSAGLRLAHLGPKAVEQAIKSATALEKNRLEKWLAYLGTVGNNAPFVGLFGTVIGIIEAFEHLGDGAKAVGQTASQAVMTSIAEALVTTAIGILVALPAVAFYNYLQRRVVSLLSGTEALTHLLLAYLEEPGRVFPKVKGD